MSNDIVSAFGGSLPETFNPNALLNAAARLPQTGDKPYLVFRDGEWTFGVEQAEIDPENDVWAINPNSFMFGLIEWCESTAGGEILVPAGQDYSPADVPRKFEDDPESRVVPQVACDLYCVSGNYPGQQVNYKTSTRGGTSVLNKMAKMIAAQYAVDQQNIVPIVTLDSDSYIHKKYNRKTYVPIMALAFWDDMEFSKATKKFGAVDGDAEEPAPEPKAATRQRGRRVRS